MQSIVILLLFLIFGLVLLSAFLFFYYWKMKKTMDVILENGKVKDIKNVLFSHIEKTKEIEKTLAQALNKIKELDDISKITIQKTGIIRFNPFNGLGGNQSFSIALLDNENNGFVISSLFTQEGNRVYAKSITNGKSDHLLSTEEQQAIIKAIKQ